MDNEIWKDIEDFEGMYQVSNKGRVKSLDRTVKQRTNSTQVKKSRFIVGSMNQKGYPLTGLTKNNIKSSFATHRLVAETFIENPESKETVNHIDGVKTNNNVDNLEWNTYKENIAHSWEIGNHSLRPDHMDFMSKNSIIKNSKKVGRYTKDNVYIDSFNSIREGAEHVGINYRGVSACVNGTQLTSGGFKWKLE